eukprot:TRINITY_DN4503_c0_g1_i1.p1 TRINITY_DN4503_c0_g1~~TRINITY_DN4503_c0_g1_i1.p1  ORF type:complete len:430 (+),score=65.45 TRINITY_DN4503_c0_g1_i1:29-1318(+)
MSDVSFDDFRSSTTQSSYRSRRTSTTTNSVSEKGGVKEVVTNAVVSRSSSSSSSRSRSSCSSSSRFSSASDNMSAASSNLVGMDQIVLGPASCSSRSSSCSITVPSKTIVAADDSGVVHDGIRTVELNRIPPDIPPELLATIQHDDLSSSSSSGEKSIISGIDLIRSIRRKKVTKRPPTTNNARREKANPRGARKYATLQKRELPKNVTQKGITESNYEQLRHLTGEKQALEREIVSLKNDIQTLEKGREETEVLIKEIVLTGAAIAGTKQSRHKNRLTREFDEIQTMKDGIEKYTSRITTTRTELSTATHKAKSSTVASLQKSANILASEIRNLRTAIHVANSQPATPSQCLLEQTRATSESKSKKLDELRSKISTLSKQCSSLEDAKRSYFERFKIEQQKSATNQAVLVDERLRLRYAPPFLTTPFN